MDTMEKVLVALLATSMLLAQRAKAQDYGYDTSYSYNSNPYEETGAVSQYSNSNSQSYTPVIEVIPPPAPRPYETGEEGSSYKFPDEDYNSSPYLNSGVSSFNSYSTSSGSVNEPSGSDYLPLESTYPSSGSAYQSAGAGYQPDEEYSVKPNGGQGSYTEDDFSFITSFDQIISLVASFQESLTKPMQQLVSDTTGKTGLALCKLSSTRIRLTRAVKKLLKSFGHWAKLGTTLEESHCRQDALQSLDAFLLENERVAEDLASIQDDIDEQPLTTFRHLENLLSKIKHEFESGRGVLVSDYTDPHHSH